MREPIPEPEEARARDWEILARVASGDLDAFSELVERYQNRVLGVCFRLLADRAEAEDAAQEAFLKLFRKAGSFRPDARVYTLLYRIAVNHCLNRLRRHKIVRMIPFVDRRDDKREDGPTLDPPDDSPDPLASLESRRRWAATRRAIDALPVSQRSVLVLTKFEGLSYRQTAEALGITEGAVESRLFRAMRRLEAEAAQERPAPGVSRKR